MNRCTIIDRLTDDYGIKPENLTEREKAIIGLCTGEFLENEEQALSLGAVVGRSEQLKAFLRWAENEWMETPPERQWEQMFDEYFKRL